MTGAQFEIRIDGAPRTYRDRGFDGGRAAHQVRHPSFKRLVPWLRLACAIAQAPRIKASRTPVEKRSFFTMPIMSSPMNSAMLMFRNSASHASRADHIQIERQFSCPLRALVLKFDRDARGADLTRS